MRYKTAPIGLSLSQHAEYCRNIYFGLALTAFGTGECATEVEGECVDTDALVAGHDTKQNATPAPFRCRCRVRLSVGLSPSIAE